MARRRTTDPESAVSESSRITDANAYECTPLHELTATAAINDYRPSDQHLQLSNRSSSSSNSASDLVPRSRLPLERSATSLPRPALLVKITLARLSFMALTVGLGVGKAITSYKGGSVASTTLDWIMGVVISLTFFWLACFERAKPPVMFWYLHKDYGTETLLLFHFTWLVCLFFIALCILYSVLYVLLPGLVMRTVCPAPQGFSACVISISIVMLFFGLGIQWSLASFGDRWIAEPSYARLTPRLRNFLIRLRPVVGIVPLREHSSDKRWTLWRPPYHFALLLSFVYIALSLRKGYFLGLGISMPFS